MIVNRTHEAAEQAAAWRSSARVGSVADIAAADVLVNTTSVGMGSDESPLDAALLHDELVVADIVYHPLAHARCCAMPQPPARRTVDGLGMLVHQAVRQQQLWTGVGSGPCERCAKAAEAGTRRKLAASLAQMLRYLTAGESHGQALVVVVEGLPAGIEITVEEIQAEMARRRLGFGRGPRQRFEVDELTLVGGVRHGRTLGSPVAIEIKNTEWFRSDAGTPRCRLRRAPPRNR